MTKTTDIVLITAHRDYGWHVLSDYLFTHHAYSKLKQSFKTCHGSAPFDRSIYMCAVYDLNVKRFIELFKKNDWMLPSMVQLLLRTGDEKVFTPITVNEVKK